MLSGALLPLADAVALAVSFLVTAMLVRRAEPGTALSELVALGATLPGWLLLAGLYGLYGRESERVDRSTADDAPALLNMVTLGIWLYYALARTTPLPDPSLAQVVAFWALTILTTFLLRGLVRTLGQPELTGKQTAVILGAGDVGRLLGRKIANHPEYGIDVVGFVDDTPRRAQPGEPPILGSSDRLVEVAHAWDVDRVFVAFAATPDTATLDHVRTLTRGRIRVDIVPRLFEVIGDAADVQSVAGIPVVSLPPLRLRPAARTAKRALDLIGAASGLLLAFPALAVIAVLVKLDSPGPVFFSQTRVGEGGRPFRIWKVRTMAVDADARKHEVASLNQHLGTDPRMFKIRSDPRVTPIGCILRRFSLDELPQLLNVFLGHMSLVGPRPLIPAEQSHVTDWAETRLHLRPGITGLWQTLGRSDIPFEEMVRLDYLYVTSWSVWSDIRIILRTFAVIWRSHGAY